MDEKRPRSIAGLLDDEGSDLGRTVRRAREMESLRRALVSVLPVELDTHVVGLNVSGDTLVVLVDSAAWATRLRHLQDTCLSGLKSSLGLDLQRIRVLVRAPVA